MSPDKDFYYEGFSGPNGTIVPDDVFDLLAPQLKESELRVLLYIVRRTFGFGKNADAISLKQLTDGIVTRDGRVLDYGTGMSRKAVISGVRGLAQKGIITIEHRQSERGDSQVNIYRLRFRHGEEVVTKGNYPGDTATPPPVTTSNPQDSVIQDSEEQNNTNVVVPDPSEEQYIYKDLKAIGVHHNTAAKLIRDNEITQIRRALDYLMYRLEGGWQPQETPAAWIVAAIKEKYVIPDRPEALGEPTNDPVKIAEEAAQRAAEVSEQFADERRRLLEHYGVEQYMEKVWQAVQAQLRSKQEWSPVLAAAVLRLNSDNTADLLAPVAILEHINSQIELITRALKSELGHEVRLSVKPLGR